MKSKLRFGTAMLVTAACAGVVCFFLRLPDQPQHSEVDSKSVDHTVGPVTEPATLSEPPRNTPARRPADPVDYASALKLSKNYLDFVRSAIEAARSGNKDAEYYLGKGLGYCDGYYSQYFEHNGVKRTFDEGLRFAAKLHRANGFAQDIYNRCHDLKDQGAEEFGNAADWLAKAAKAGQPSAQAAMALDTLSREALRASAQAAGNPAVTDTPIDKSGESRALLLAAVESKDPEALWIVGMGQGFLYQSDDDAQKNELAWWLVSCQRGFDCSPEADWRGGSGSSDRISERISGRSC